MKLFNVLKKTVTSSKTFATKESVQPIDRQQLEKVIGGGTNNSSLFLRKDYQLEQNKLNNN